MPFCCSVRMLSSVHSVTSRPPMVYTACASAQLNWRLTVTLVHILDTDDI